MQTQGNRTLKIAWGIVWGVGSEIWEISHNSLNLNIIEHYFPIALSVFLYTLRPVKTQVSFSHCERQFFLSHCEGKARGNLKQ